MIRPDVVVFDYGFGNVHSAAKALEAAGANVTLTADAKRAADATGLLVPGVGSFAAVMRGLVQADGPRIIDQRLSGGRPVMGICVGMQVLFERGLEGSASESTPIVELEETVERVHARNAESFWWDDEVKAQSSGTAGLEQWPGVVRRLRAQRLPHIGWNTVDVSDGSALFRGVERERFYFVHSFAATDIDIEPPSEYSPPVLETHTTYGERFLSAVENGPLTATQFHPEKSGAAGIQLLRNWLATF